VCVCIVLECGYLFSSSFCFFFFFLLQLGHCDNTLHSYKDEQKSLISVLCAISLSLKTWWMGRGEVGDVGLWRTRVSLLLLLPTQPWWSVIGNQIKAIKERVHALLKRNRERGSLLQEEEGDWADYLNTLQVIDTLPYFTRIDY